MITRTSPSRQLHGNTMLFDSSTGLIKSGQISVKLEEGSACLDVESPVTKLLASRNFTSPEQVEVITWLVDQILAAHGNVDVGVSHNHQD